MSDSDRMPAAFIGHGSPMNTLEHNRYTDAWRDFGAAVAAPAGHPRDLRPLVHQRHRRHRDGTPRVIHDFYGFPDELFAFDYPAPGDARRRRRDRRDRQAALGRARRRQLGARSRHLVGARALLPRADVPVLQLSINALQAVRVRISSSARASRRCASAVS